jgi:hypothetical protein
MFRSSKFVVVLTFAWLSGWTALTIGQVTDAGHRLNHSSVAVSDHDHDGHHGAHSHDPEDPHHIPLPFDSFIGLIPIMPTLSGAIPGFTLVTLAAVIFPGADLLIPMKKEFAASPQGPPLLTDNFHISSLSNRAPPSVA